MGAGSVALLGAASPGHRERQRAPLVSTSTHHPTARPAFVSEMEDAEVRHRGGQSTIPQTITTFDTHPEATTSIRHASTNAHALDRHRRPQIQQSLHCLRSAAKWAHLRPLERHADAPDGRQRGRTTSRLTKDLSYGSRPRWLSRFHVSRTHSRRGRSGPAHSLEMALEHPSARCRRGHGGAELNHKKCRAMALSAPAPAARSARVI